MVSRHAQGRPHAERDQYKGPGCVRRRLLLTHTTKGKELNTVTTTLEAADSQAATNSRGKVLGGRIMTAVPALFLVMDAVGKLLKPKPVVEGTIQLGYPEGVLLGLGIVLLVCTILYIVPCTAILGAILLTGYLGGAIATHVRVGNPLFSHVMFPVYIAVLLWGGLFLREPRLRELIPFRK